MRNEICSNEEMRAMRMQSESVENACLGGMCVGGDDALKTSLVAGMLFGHVAQLGWAVNVELQCLPQNNPACQILFRLPPVQLDLNRLE
jgi:hypothetical protein